MAYIPITDPDIRESYSEDTIGRKYHPSITTKNNTNTKEPNGDVVTLDCSKPMTAKEFLKLSSSLKVIYLRHLRDTYNANINDICDLFKVSRSWVYSNINKALHIKNFFKQDHRMTRDERQAWNQFLTGNIDDTETVDEVDYTEENTGETTVVNVCNVVDKTATAIPYPSKITNHSFGQRGYLNASELVSNVLRLIPEGTLCEISLNITVLD